MDDGRTPIEALDLHEKIEHLPFDDYFLLMAMCVAAHDLHARGNRPGAAHLFDGIDRLAGLLLASHQ